MEVEKGLASPSQKNKTGLHKCLVFSVMFVFNRDFRYVRIYVYVCVCGRTSSYMRMLNSSLLGHKKLRSLVVHIVGGIKLRLLLKHSNHWKRTIKMF